ncbi:MAG TPA: hypothetical protein VGM81_03360 [Burkholderiaceae bacterium]
MRALPKINSKYWQALVLASIFGTNTGDFFAGRLHMGHLNGLPLLIGLFALILWVERFSPRASVLYFWAAIITVRTAATNVGDAFHDFKLGFGISIPIVIVLFAISIAIYKKAGESSPARSTEPSVRVDTPYWVCMMLAGVLGTLAGDWLAEDIGLKTLGATAVYGLFVAAMLYTGRGGRMVQPIFYWVTIALIRSAGTAAGDFVAHSISLPVGTALTGTLFIALIVYFYEVKKINAVALSAA